MLRPPSDYVLATVSLSSRTAKVENLNYDSAIIFFTPKVADKRVDLASLQCTIVQITDRGEWGKEEESFTVEASSFENRKRRVFDLTTDAEYSLKIIPPPELRMGILEIYFDPTMSPSSNPSVPQNLTAADITAGMVAAAPQLATAIGNASRDAMAAQFTNTTAKNTNEILIKVKAWTGNVANHIVLAASTTRLGIKSSNQGNNTVYINSGTPSTPNALQFGNYDDYMERKGTWYALENERLLPLIMYLDPGKPDQDVSITELLP